MITSACILLGSNLWKVWFREILGQEIGSLESDAFVTAEFAIIDLNIRMGDAS